MSHSQRTGASFRLSAPARQDMSERLATDWTAAATKGSSYIVVSGPTSAASYEEALELCLDAAQEGLDFFSIRGRESHVLAEADKGHVVWWSEPRGKVLRMFTLGELREPSVSGEGYFVRGDGTIPPRPLPPIVEWSPSFRYYRLSQASTDLMDSYRNLYLAFESLLGTLVPQQTSGRGASEGESQWLRRALSTIDGQFPLAPFAKRGSTNPVEDLFDEIYKGTRTRVFHSKPGRPTLLPHGTNGRKDVVASLQRLGHLYLEMTRKYLSVSRRGGMFSTHALQSMLDFPGEVSVSEHSIEEVEQPGSTTMLKKVGDRVVDHQHTWIGEIHVPALGLGFGPIRSAVLWRHGEVFAADVLDEPVDISDVDFFQCEMGIRFINPRRPRVHFPT